MPLKAVALNATAVPGRAPYAIFGGSIAKAQVDGGARTKCFHYA
jgi:hypothetical protein